MNIKEVKSNILKNYIDNCKHYKLRINRMLLKYLEEDPVENSCLNLIFKGNKDFNFNSRITNNDLDLLILSYQDYEHLITHIDLSYNWINGKIMDNFSKFLEKCHNIESLNLQFNDIEEEGSLYLFPSLIKMKDEKKLNLKYLNLEGCRVKSMGIMGCTSEDIIFNKKVSYIEEFLKNNKNIIELNLGHNDLDEEGLINLISSWNPNSSYCNLEILNLDSPLLTSKTDVIAFHIGRTLQNNTQLSKLSLRKFKLDDTSISIIFKHLFNNDKLRVIDLEANLFTFKGLKLIGKYLKNENCTLESLIINNNRTGDIGAKIIAEVLKENKTLIHLDMRSNNIDDEGLKIISKSLKINESLASFRLFNNNFGPNSIKNYHKLLNKNKNPNRVSDWFFDFHTYNLDGKIQIFQNDNEIDYDIYVSQKYYIEEI